MKFTHGTWFLKDNVKLITANEVRAYDVDERSVTLHAPMRKISHRGETLDGPMLTYRFSSPVKDIIKVQIYHFLGTDDDKKNPQFLGEIPISETLSEKNIVVNSGDLSVKIDLNKALKYEFSYKGKYLTKSEEKSSAHVMHDNSCYMREQLNIGVNEHVYGLGERFGPFVKNGSCVEMWNEDSGTNSDLTYKNIPFYVTNNNYGVLVNNSGKASFEIDTERLGRVNVSVKGEYLEYYIMAGDTMKHVISRYTDLTGKPPVVPLWSLGLWLSTSFSTDYNEETVMHFIDKMQEKEIPLSVFHFDCFWMKEMEWCNFEWDRESFKDPEKMIMDIHDKGIKTCAWINPYFAQKSPLFQEGHTNGYFLKRPEGGTFQRNEWQAALAVLDVTNPDAIEWYKDKLRKVLHTGIDSFKTDFGERIPVNVKYYDGSDPEIMRNRYAYLYNKIVYELLVEEKGEKDALVFARAAWVGSQQFPTHWGGDCWSTYQSMLESLRGGLSLALSGFAYWSHDVGGFEDASSADIYKRWVAFGLLSSHSRLHGSRSYRVPWNYDEESVDVLRFFTKLKMKLIPYYYALSHDANTTGIPLMRPLVLEFQEDKNCHYIEQQFMIGDSLMIAPIFNEHSEANYYLPQGNWFNILSNQEYVGGQWIQEEQDYLSLPLMLRENSILPMIHNTNQPVAELENISFMLYRLFVGEHSYTIYGENGETGTIFVQVENNTITISVKELKKCEVSLPMTRVISTTGKIMNEEQNIVLLDESNSTTSIQIERV